jgi:hypothetical protein
MTRDLELHDKEEGRYGSFPNCPMSAFEKLFFVNDRPLRVENGASAHGSACIERCWPTIGQELSVKCYARYS